jgi:hypothetical protein
MDVWTNTVHLDAVFCSENKFKSMLHSFQSFTELNTDIYLSSPMTDHEQTPMYFGEPHLSHFLA